MKWILILIIGGTHATSATFNDKAACEAAKTWVQSASRYYRVECFPTERPALTAQ